MSWLETRADGLEDLVRTWPSGPEPAAWLAYLAKVQLVPELDYLAREATRLARGGGLPQRWQDVRERCLRLADSLVAPDVSFPARTVWRPQQELLNRVAGAPAAGAQ